VSIRVAVVEAEVVVVVAWAVAAEWAAVVVAEGAAAVADLVPEAPMVQPAVKCRNQLISGRNSIWPNKLKFKYPSVCT
jgi:hypothetical protein